MQAIKDLWAKWKVSMSFVGGALVVATAYGTCTVEPDKEAIQEAVLPEAKVEEPAEKVEEPAEAEPIPVEKVEEVEGAKEAKE